MSKQSAGSAICLVCGKARAAPQKEVFRDIYNRPMTFCNSVCYSQYIKKQARA